MERFTLGEYEQIVRGVLESTSKLVTIADHNYMNVGELDTPLKVKEAYAAHHEKVKKAIKDFGKDVSLSDKLVQNELSEW